MEELKQAIQTILSHLDADISFQKLMESFTSALSAHPEALGALEGRYRLQTTDTGVNVGFALSSAGLEMLDEAAQTDAVISARENDLLQIIRHELNPMTAMFTGRLSVKGSMQALMKFAQIL